MSAESIAGHGAAGPAAPAAPGNPAAQPGLFRRRVWVPLFAAWWTAFGLLFAARDYATGARLEEPPFPWTEAVKLGFFHAFLMALLALVALWAARRFPLERRTWKANLGLHAAIGVAAVVVNLLLMHLLVPVVTTLPRQPLLLRYVAYFPAWCFLYLLMLGVGFGIGYFRRYHDRELRTSQLATQLARAKLQTLKMQLHPHFLFNTLNSISALMHRDVKAADRMLGRLEDLLRMTIAKAGSQEVRLREELMVLEPYLEIEQARFRDRLRVVWDVEPEALEACVPHLILQPLVENAIKHGIAPRSSPGCIAIVARRTADRLILEIRDNGPGLGDGDDEPGGLRQRDGGMVRGAARADGVGAAITARARRGTGVGLANTRARLEQLYPGAHRFEMENAFEGGTIARITVPFRLPEAEPDPDARRSPTDTT